MRQILVPLSIDPAVVPGGSVLHAASGSTMGTSWSAQLMLPPGVRSDLGQQMRRPARSHRRTGGVGQDAAGRRDGGIDGEGNEDLAQRETQNALYSGSASSVAV